MISTVAQVSDRARELPDASARGRVLLTGYFAGLGVVMAVWGTRIPAVQESAGLNTAGLAAVLFGVAHGVLDVGLNAAAVRCQDAYGRPIMSGLHRIPHRYRNPPPPRHHLTEEDSQ
ncbi:hypothetical protein [Nocardia sp. N2S4-5]|uniref:hypothetical protein n=1 Tax=Nocardia sp. N2S4-5 TaxID=3351565 RepID=UPI0037D33669